MKTYYLVKCKVATHLETKVKLGVWLLKINL